MFSGMIPRGRGRGSSNRGRGRGSNSRQDIVLAQMAGRRLIASNIASSSSVVHNNTNDTEIQIDPNDPLYEKVMAMIKAQKEEEASKVPSYAYVAQDNDEEDSWFITERQKKIILLNQEDVEFFDDPWILMQKYIEPASYEASSYKTRQYYENILQLTETA